MRTSPTVRPRGSIILLGCGALAVAWASCAAPRAAAQGATTGAAGAEVAPSDPELRPSEFYLGRQIAPPMHFSGAGWLTRPTRAEEEDPARLLRWLQVRPGQTVCDFGCGNGYHTLQLAKRVGPQGVVYAVDIQQEMLVLLQERAGPRGLDNIRPILATEDDAGLPSATFDLVLMVDVYHELFDPPAVLAAVRASLKPEGRLVLVEFREEDPTVPILPLHKMSQQQVLRELRPNGFKLVRQFDGLPIQHVLEFARDDAPSPAIELTPWQSDKSSESTE